MGREEEPEEPEEPYTSARLQLLNNNNDNDKKILFKNIMVSIIHIALLDDTCKMITIKYGGHVHNEKNQLNKSRARLARDSPTATAISHTNKMNK